MRILVTGGAGYVGSVLVPYLLADGHKVRVLDNLTYGISGLFNCFNHKNFEFVDGDVSDAYEYEKAVNNIDAVIHLAAIVGYPACKKDEALAESVNVGGSVVAVSETDLDVPIVFASTGSVYGEIGDVCLEDTPINPLTIYGKTKGRAEEVFKNRGNCVIYRFATAYGISPRLRLDLMINDFCYKAVNEKNLILYEQYSRRTFIHVTDMAESFLFAIENIHQMRDQIYNVGSADMNLTKKQIAEEIQLKANFYLHCADYEKDADKRDYVVDYEKIASLGFKPSKPLTIGVHQLVQLFKVMHIKSQYSNV